MTGLLLLVAAALAGGAWWQFLQGRERARQSAGRTCKAHGLLLIDDTVVLDAVRFERGDRGPRLGLSYRFDFAFQGRLHHGGRVLVLPNGGTTVAIETVSGQVIEEFPGRRGSGP